MDLIYFILSVFLRLSPAVRKLSSVSVSGAKHRRRNWVGLAFWLPMVGWVSVSVQHMPGAQWLTWRVREVRSFHFSALDSRQKQSREVDSKSRGRKLPPRLQAPESSGDSRRNVN